MDAESYQKIVNESFFTVKGEIRICGVDQHIELGRADKSEIQRIKQNLLILC